MAPAPTSASFGLVPTASASPPEGRAAVADFAALLALGAPATPPRGRLTLGLEPTGTTGPDLAGDDLLAASETVPGQPLILPDPTAAAKPAETPAPDILADPFAGDGAKAGGGTLQPDVLPDPLAGTAAAKPVSSDGNGLALAQALSALNVSDGVEDVTETIRRAVNAAPTVQPLEAGEAEAEVSPLLTEEAALQSPTSLAATARAGTGAVDPNAPAGAVRPATEGAAERLATETVSAGDADILPGLAPEGEDGAAPTPRADIPARVDLSPTVRGGPDAVAQIAAQILRRLDGRTTRFDMQLTPAELGRVDVRLDIDAEGRLAARLAFDNPVAAADLRGRVDELRRDLAEAGFDVASDAFSFEERSPGDERGWASDRTPSARAFNQGADLAEAADLSTLRVVVRDGLDLRI